MLVRVAFFAALASCVAPGCIPALVATVRLASTLAAALGLERSGIQRLQPGRLIQACAWAEAAVRHADTARQYVAKGTRGNYKEKLDAAGLAAAEAMVPSPPICLAPK